MIFNFDDTVAFEMGYKDKPRYDDCGIDNFPDGTSQWIEATVIGFHPIENKLILVEYKTSTKKSISCYIWCWNLKKIYKCECGAEKLFGKHTGHSSWCAATKNVKTI